MVSRIMGSSSCWRREKGHEILICFTTFIAGTLENTNEGMGGRNSRIKKEGEME